MVLRNYSRRPQASWQIGTVIACFALLVPLQPGIAAGAPETSIPTVSVVQARHGEIARRIRLTGSLVARHESLVTVDLDQAARIEAVLGEVGDDVALGQILARLDDSAIRIELDVNAAKLQRAGAAIQQAQAEVADAGVAQDEAASSLSRGRKLRDKGVTAADALEKLTFAADRAATTLDIQRKALALAEADRTILSTERRDIEARLARTLVRAPVAGRILKRTAKVGALVGSGSAEMFSIADDGEIEVAAEVPQTDFLQIPAGAGVAVTVPGIPTPLTGIVRLIEPAMQAAGRQGLVRVAITNDAGNHLPTGAFVRGEVEVDRHSAVLLPASAVETKEGQAEIQIIENDVVAPRAATTGMRSGELVEILSGISAGETIVLKAGSFLDAGDRIRPVMTSFEGEPVVETPLKLALDRQP